MKATLRNTKCILSTTCLSARSKNCSIPHKRNSSTWVFYAKNVLDLEREILHFDKDKLQSIATDQDSQLIQVELRDSHEKDFLQRSDYVNALQVLPNVTTFNSELTDKTGKFIVDYLKEFLPLYSGLPIIVHAIALGNLRGKRRKAFLDKRARYIARDFRIEMTRDKATAPYVQYLREPTPLAVFTRPTQKSVDETFLLIQFIALSHATTLVSISPSTFMGVGHWPNLYSCGLGDHNNQEPSSPSSAFRKLEEALYFLGELPTSNQNVLDLGACPGGWTSVFQKYDTKIKAIDRTPIASDLLKNLKTRMIIKNAFTEFSDYKKALLRNANRPEIAGEDPLYPSVWNWVLSDVVAQPENTLELMRDWSSIPSHVERLIMNMKFTGDDFNEKMASIAKVRELFAGTEFDARIKRFYNDKNEFTLVARRKELQPRVWHAPAPQEEIIIRRIKS